MSIESKSDNEAGFVDINQLRAESPVTVERLFAYYGVPAPVLVESGKELRMACPFSHCGKSGPTGNKAISIQADSRGFIWRCFHYGCAHGGNDVGFADLLRDASGDGKPRGERFREVLKDYQDMAGGAVRRIVANPAPSHRVDRETPQENVPLEESDNERARQLANLHEKFLVDQAKMPPAAASYQRIRPQWFGDPEEVLREWQAGYLANDAGGDRSGGTMQGKMVFPVRGLDGRILAWRGRDPDWEAKHREWASLSEEKRAKEPEPMKWRFPKGFHRGLELSRAVIFRSRKPSPRCRSAAPDGKSPTAFRTGDRTC